MKRILKWGLIIIVLLIAFGYWYNWKYSMGIANNYTVNSQLIENKLLVATQQSEYKDEVTQYITEHFIGKDLYISVIDVTELGDEPLENYQAFVIIHSIQMWEPPEEVVSFLENQELKNRAFIISTSGPGDLLPDGVDGVSSASVVIEAKKDAEEAIAWISKKFRLGI